MLTNWSIANYYYKVTRHFIECHAKAGKLDLELKNERGKIMEIAERDKMTKEEEKTLSNELSNLLNRYSRENDSNTPDFILANYMMMCLRAGEYLVNMREQWKNK